MPGGRAPHRSAFAALGLLSVIWGYNWVVMKVAMRDANPLAFAALRTFLGALSLFAVLRWRGTSLAPRRLPAVALLGFLQTTAFVGLTVWAVSIGGAGRTAVLVYTMPFWVLALAWWWLGERPPPAQWVAVGVAAAGLVLVIDPGGLGGELPSKLLAIAAGVTWAASAVLAKRLQAKGADELLRITAWQMLLGSLPLLALWPILAPGGVRWTASFAAALAYNAVPANALAWLLWLYILGELPAGVAGLSMLATPLVGVVSAWLQLGERPSPKEAGGMALVALALGLLSARGLARAPPLKGEESTRG